MGDKTKEELATTTQKLDDKEKALLAAEMEVNTLNRRVQHLEGDLEVCEDKLLLATQKLDKAATAADDSDRMRKVFESKAAGDEERMAKLEDDLKHIRTKAEEADKQYDEVSKKLQVTESDLERAEERGEMGETKIMELAEEKANQREVSYKDQIKTLTAKLKQAEARAEFAEKSVQKLQKEVDRLEDELMGEQEKLKGIAEELEQTFAEMSGY